MAMFVSFIARALSSIPGNVFCYSAISSSGIVSILPGFMIRENILAPPSQAHANLNCSDQRPRTLLEEHALRFSKTGVRADL